MAHKPKPPPSPLIDAASAFAEELRSYALLSQAFLRAPLSSAKHLERVNDTLGQLAAAETRLGAAGQALAAAVAKARDEQLAAAQAVLDRVPLVKARTTELASLLGRFDQLGGRAAELNQTAAAPGVGDDRQARARALADKLDGLLREAEEVTAAARAAEFEELERRGHALCQQLSSARKKLELATLSPVVG